MWWNCSINLTTQAKNPTGSFFGFFSKLVFAKISMRTNWFKRLFCSGSCPRLVVKSAVRDHSSVVSTLVRWLSPENIPDCECMSTNCSVTDDKQKRNYYCSFSVCFFINIFSLTVWVSRESVERSQKISWRVKRFFRENFSLIVQRRKWIERNVIRR